MPARVTAEGFFERTWILLRQHTHEPAHTQSKLLYSAGGGGLYTAVKVFMAFWLTKRGNEGERESRISPKSIWTAGWWNYTGSRGHVDKWGERWGWKEGDSQRHLLACWRTCVDTRVSGVSGKKNKFIFYIALSPSLSKLSHPWIHGTTQESCIIETCARMFSPSINVEEYASFHKQDETRLF